MANRFSFKGKRFKIDMGTRSGIRMSPPANAQARAFAKCARGKRAFTERKKCMEELGSVKGK